MNNILLGIIMITIGWVLLVLEMEVQLEDKYLVLTRLASFGVVMYGVFMLSYGVWGFVL